jgi:predicted esterase
VTLELKFDFNLSGTVIFIHGLGDTAAGWVSEMRRFNLANPHLKFILPTAYAPPSLFICI